MELKELLNYQNIVVQCHDNPDADTVASGYAVYEYLKKHDKNVHLVYGGRNAIRKSNLVMMINNLDIPIEHVNKLEKPDLLITVDCQYGEGNVTSFDAEKVAVIDHHHKSEVLPELSEVRTYLGSCCTLVWDLLKNEGVDINEDKKVSTALYYGLYTDTNGLSEIAHPLDRDLRDYAQFDEALITKLRNANMSLEELEIAGTALLRSDYVEENRFAIVKAGACDPNILGVISDLVLEVDAIDVCVVFNVLSNGVKLSVRSCVKEVRASELAEEITRGIGSGGGHAVKAGGFIPMEQVTLAYLKLCEEQNRTPRMHLSEDGTKEIPSASGVKFLLERRMMDYFADTEIIYADNYEIDLSSMQHYIRKPCPLGYVIGTDLEPVGSRMKLRTVQGDREVQITEDTVFLIDPRGRVRIDSLARFKQRNRCYPSWRFHVKDSAYSPTIKSMDKEKMVSLLSYSGVCILEEIVAVKARPLTHKVKLFGKASDATYAVGKPGDMLIVDEQHIEHMYVLNGEAFEKGYQLENKDEREQKIDAVIFDLDGTLLDTLEDLKNSVNAALQEFDLPLRTLEEVRCFVGNGVRNLMIRAVPQGEEHPQFEEIFDAFKKHYAVHCNDTTGPYSNIMNLLEELQARGIRMGIVSNKIDSAVKELADIYFKGYMEAAIGEKEGVARKPAPDTALLAMKEMNVAPEHTLYVGDSDVDIETARNAGMKCISVSWGFRDEEFLLKHGAEHIIKRPLDFLSYI